MDRKCANRTQLLRHGVQLAAFLIAPALFATVFSALGEVVTALAAGTFTLTGMAAPLVILAVVLLITALWGRVFCGWLCAFGALGDLLGWIARKLRIPQLPRSERADRALRWIKYGVLMFAAIAMWALALPIDTGYSPWSAFGMLTSWNPAVMRAVLSTVGCVLLLGIMIASLFVERFFCRYLCPLGALLALVSKRRLFRVERKATLCSGCAACTRACPMNVAVHADDAAASGECISCLRCTGACHADCLDAKASPALTGATVAAALAGMVLLGGAVTPTDTAKISTEPAPAELSQRLVEFPHGKEGVQMPDTWNGNAEQGFRHHRHDTGGQAPETGGSETPQRRFGAQDGSESKVPQRETQAPAEGGTTPKTPDAPTGDVTKPTDSADHAAFDDGVYTGTGTGYRGNTTVQVTVEGGEITNIEVMSYRDDRSFFERAKSVIQSILAKQSTEVDTVSGATYSSRGIIAAVADALNIEYEAAQSAVRGSRYL